MPELRLQDFPLRKTLKGSGEDLLYLHPTWERRLKVLAYSPGADRVAVVFEYHSNDGRPWIDGALIFGDTRKLAAAHALLTRYSVPRITVDKRRLGESVEVWNRDEALLAAAAEGSIVKEGQPLIRLDLTAAATTSPRSGPAGRIFASSWGSASCSSSASL